MEKAQKESKNTQQTIALNDLPLVISTIKANLDFSSRLNDDLRVNFHANYFHEDAYFELVKNDGEVIYTSPYYETINNMMLLFRKKHKHINSIDKLKLEIKNRITELEKLQSDLENLTSSISC